MSSFAKFGGTFTSTNIVGRRVSHYGIVPEEGFQKKEFDHAALSGRHICGQHCENLDHYCMSYPAGQEHNSCNMLEKPGHSQNWHALGKRVFGHHLFDSLTFASWYAEAHGHQDLGHNHGHNRFYTQGSPP